jgi:hypothetical protein
MRVAEREFCKSRVKTYACISYDYLPLTFILLPIIE